MTSPLIERLEPLIGTPRDNALLRYSLGSEYAKAGESGRAIEHLQAALEHDDGYSAAWKLLGRTLTDAGRGDEAIACYQRGISAARTRGDRQAEKEMTVFLKRLEKARHPGEDA